MCTRPIHLGLKFKINWHKSNIIWICNSPKPFKWGTEHQLKWLAPSESTGYLGFSMDFQVPTKQKFKTILQNLKKKLSYWCTTKLSLTRRILIANQVLLALIWYLASCWSTHSNTLAKVKSLMRNYIWWGENGEKKCRANVKWNSLILPKDQGRIKLIDPTLQTQALLAKLMIRGLMLGDAPWRSVIQFCMRSIKPKRGGKWLSNIHFILFATWVSGSGSNICWVVWKAWCQIRHNLKFQQPLDVESTSRQNLF